MRFFPFFTSATTQLLLSSQIASSFTNIALFGGTISFRRHRSDLNFEEFAHSIPISSTTIAGIRQNLLLESRTSRKRSFSLLSTTDDRTEENNGFESLEELDTDVVTTNVIQEETTSTGTTQAQQKEEEMILLSREKQLKDTEVNRLKFQLNELRSAIEESEQRSEEAERKIESLEKESENVINGTDEKDVLPDEVGEQEEKVSLDKSDANGDIDEAKRIAKEEKVDLELEIEMLKSALDVKSKQMVEAQEKVAEVEDKINDQMEKRLEILLDEKMKQQSLLKQEEIDKYSQEVEQKQTEINRLKFQLSDLRAAIKDSENRREESQRMIESLKDEGAALKVADENALAEMKEQMSELKESLSEKLRSAAEDLTRTKLDANKKLEEVKMDAQNKKKNLEKELVELRSEFEERSKELDKIKEEQMQIKEKYETQLSNERAASQIARKAINSVNGREKRELKKITWDLETKIQAAKYQAVLANKEVKRLEAKSKILEEELRQREKILMEEVTELQGRIDAELMFYERQKVSARDRLVRLVQKFNQRLQRRQVKAEQTLLNSRLEMENKIEAVQKTMEEEKQQLLLEKSDEIEKSKALTEIELRAASDRYDAMILDMDNKIGRIKRGGELKLKRLKQRMTNELKNERERAVAEKEAVIKKKDGEISKQKQEAEKAYNDLEKDLTDQLTEVNQIKIDLLYSIKGKEAKIEAYEEEQASIRRLLRLTLRLIRNKSRTFVSRRKSK